jgi:hypothetical protein
VQLKPFHHIPFVRQQASVVRALFLRQSFNRLDGLHFVPTVLGSFTPLPQSYALSYFCQLPLTHTGSGSSCHVHKPAQFHSGSHLAGRHPTRHFLIKPSHQPNPIGVLLTILPAMKSLPIVHPSFSILAFCLLNKSTNKQINNASTHKPINP